MAWLFHSVSNRPKAPSLPLLSSPLLSDPVIIPDIPPPTQPNPTQHSPRTTASPAVAAALLSPPSANHLLTMG
ncbi:hypothetical protein DL98DRAFT_513325 [Cadophora sp. DSE1049]|nr:hypothetical protein DL98DRAFT_513325 [Cadophora sp. DSE1049]